MNHRRTIVQTGHPELGWFRVVPSGGGSVQFCYISSEETLMSITSKVCQRLTNSVVSEKRIFYLFQIPMPGLVYFDIVQITMSISFCVSESILQNLFNSTWVSWSIAIIWDAETKLFQTVSTNSWNQTQQLTCHKSPTDLLQQLINNHKLLFRKPPELPPLPAHFFLVKLQGLQGPPNLKPDITICVWLQQE